MGEHGTSGVGDVAGLVGLRVLHVMESTIGGTRRHLSDVALGLAARGLDVHVVAAAERQAAMRDDLARLAHAGVHVVELPMVRQVSPGRDVRHLVALERLLADLRPDIVHTHSSKAGVLGRLASMATGIGRRVHTPHTFAFLFHAMFGAAQRRLYYELERALSGETERVIAVSRDEARLFAASGVVDPGRVRVVRNGIDPLPWRSARPVSRAELGVGPHATLAVVVGLLNVAKGQDLALEALAMPGLESVELLLVGHGECEAALRRQARELGIERRVHFLGFRTDVPAILAAADLVVLPSRWEGLPYAVLEGLAAGKAVVATPVPGAVEVLEGGAGFLAQEVSSIALSAALREALEAGLDGRAEVAARGATRLAEGYTNEHMLDGLCGVYADLLHTPLEEAHR